MTEYQLFYKVKEGVCCRGRRVSTEIVNCGNGGATMPKGAVPKSSLFTTFYFGYTNLRLIQLPKAELAEELKVSQVSCIQILQYGP